MLSVILISFEARFHARKVLKLAYAFQSQFSLLARASNASVRSVYLPICQSGGYISRLSMVKMYFSI